MNFKMSQLTPVKKIEFLELVINSVNMTFALPQIHANYSVIKGHDYGINQTPRENLVHYSDSTSSDNSV